jgi:hypothetical protein
MHTACLLYEFCASFSYFFKSLATHLNFFLACYSNTLHFLIMTLRGLGIGHLMLACFNTSQPTYVLLFFCTHRVVLIVFLSVDRDCDKYRTF